MEPLIWNKPPIWNTYAADRVVFRIGGFTVLVYVILIKIINCQRPAPRYFSTGCNNNDANVRGEGAEDTAGHFYKIAPKNGTSNME